MNLRNIKLIIEYDGTDFSGWQIQNNTQKRTVQGKIEKALFKTLSKEVKVIGAVRTDCGVHAQGQTANFLTDSKIPLDSLVKALNSFIPKDAAVLSAEEVPPDFNARYSARRKTYRYTISNAPIIRSLSRRYTWCLPLPLDVDLMKKTAKYFLGKHNFSAFSCRGSARKNEFCRITKSQILKQDEIICFEIEGTNFLYKMIRRMVGGLVEAGWKKLDPSVIQEAVETCRKDFYLPTAPPHGLCLIKVAY